MTVGDRIKEARLKANMTQAELAKKLNTSYVVISQYENNKRNPKLGTIEKIAVALGIPTKALLPDYLALEESAEYVARCISKSLHAQEIFTDEFFNSDEMIDPEQPPLFELVEQEIKLLKIFGQLNETGQEKAIERVEELGKIPEYQKAEELEDTSDGE